VSVCHRRQRFDFLPSDYGDLGIRGASKAVKSAVNTERDRKTDRDHTGTAENLSNRKTEELRPHHSHSPDNDIRLLLIMYSHVHLRGNN